MSDVQNKLVSLLDQAISLADFDQWIMSISWNLHKKAPVGSRLYNLVRDIQGVLFDYGAGEYSEAELRSELASLMPNNAVKFE